MADSTTLPLPFVNPLPFDLSAIKSGLADGAREERLSFAIPQTLWFLLDGIRFMANPSVSRTDVALYCLRQGQDRLGSLNVLSRIGADYTLLLGWHRMDLVGRLPRWSYECPDRRRWLVLRYVKSADNAWVTHWVLPLGLSHSEAHQACLLAGLVDGPIGDVSREELTWQIQCLASYLEFRAALLAKCVARAKGSSLSKNIYV